MHTHRFSRVAGLFLAALFLLPGITGCDSNDAGLDGAEGVRTELRFKTTASGAGKSASHVEVEEAKILLKTVKFNAEEGEEYEFKTESFVVNLDLTGQANTVAVGTVPPGAYERVTFKVHKPEDNEDVPDPEFKQGTSGDQRFSVIIRGNVGGDPFELKVNDSMQQRLELSPPLLIGENDNMVVVTLQADVEQWFVGEQGQPLDPRLDEHEDDIADAIKDSFRALGNDN
ncbi:MAG: hypothetical protein ACE5G0_11680 [Rhodothermales bacterium]